MDQVLWSYNQGQPRLRVVRASNTHLFDASGRRFVDLEAGCWANSLGHAHPAVAETLRSRAAMLAHAGNLFTDSVVGQAAAAVLQVTGLHGGTCTFLSSGSEAVNFAILCARAVMTRPLILVLRESYFGSHGAAVTRSNEGWHELDAGECHRCPHGRCGRECPLFAAIPFEQVGAFLLEPGSSNVVTFPPEPLVRAVAARVQEAGGWLVVNEITTGVGRTGRWFGFEHLDLAPDFVAMGKGIGGGYPVSAIAAGERACRALAAHPFHYRQSHQNDPLGAAVVCAVLDAIEREDLVVQAREKGERLLRGLQSMAREFPVIKEVRGRGLMIAIEFHGRPGSSVGLTVQQGLLARGFLVTGGQRFGMEYVRVDPSLTVPEEDLQQFQVALGGVLAALV